MAYFPKRIATVISLSEISEPLGGTIGLTVMTTVFNNVAGIGSDPTGGSLTSLSQMSPEELAVLSQNAKVPPDLRIPRH